MKVPPEIVSFLKQNDNFFIATHINPEGDAIGSSLALAMALEALGKRTTVFDTDGVPLLYHYLPSKEKVVTEVPAGREEMTLLLLDCNMPGRAGLNGEGFKATAVIDHHETESAFGEVRWIEADAAATGIMVFFLIKELGVPMTKEMAVNLYTAIAVDTGTFRFGNTDREVLSVASELAAAGVKPGFISNNLYESWSTSRFLLLIMVLNTLDIREGVAFVNVTREMFRKTGTSPDDTENFSGYPRMMKDAAIAAFFRETDDDEWKASLRSKGDINVARIAKAFGGGGHKNAAGYTVKGDIEFAKTSLLEKLHVAAAPPREAGTTSVHR
jgi:bifunctional oligoribonuclease and PAP phosphatase NrnA